MTGEKSIRTRVKICGTTRLEDALVAARHGVDALGFIFYPKSPRYISSDQAAAIIRELPPLVDRVGVFVNAPLDELVEGAGLGLSYLQLHGNESVAYCLELRRKLPSCHIIKAFRLGQDSREEDFSPYNNCVDAFLLDTYMQGAEGGTGKTFDWSVIEPLKLQRPIFLAGGLSPKNIDQAISSVQPFAVDINSGIESQPGIKDHLLIKQILQLVAKSAVI
jgi:phosphoribosylanthranilate isomerase